MSKILTAEELYIYMGYMEKHYKLGSDIKTAMIEFAKLHVQAALKEASEKYLHDETNISDNPEYLKNSILNAYPLKQII